MRNSHTHTPSVTHRVKTGSGAGTTGPTRQHTSVSRRAQVPPWALCLYAAGEQARATLCHSPPARWSSAPADQQGSLPPQQPRQSGRQSQGRARRGTCGISNRVAVPCIQMAGQQLGCVLSCMQAALPAVQRGRPGPPPHCLPSQQECAQRDDNHNHSQPTSQHLHLDQQVCLGLLHL